jgi:hypothetical protein
MVPERGGHIPRQRGAARLGGGGGALSVRNREDP